MLPSFFLQSLSGDKSFIRRLITSLKEAVRAGEGGSNDVDRARLNAFSLIVVRFSASAHGTALATFADDLVKYGVFCSSSEPVLGALVVGRNVIKRVNGSCTRH